MGASLVFVPNRHAQEAAHDDAGAEEVFVQFGVVVQLVVHVGDVDELPGSRGVAHEAVREPPTVVVEVARDVFGVEVAPFWIDEDELCRLSMQHLRDLGMPQGESPKIWAAEVARGR